MEVLWAPWRMQYILGPKPDECVLCLPTDPAPDLATDRERLVLYRGTACFVLMNKFPYNNGHIMVAPMRHTSDITTLTREESTEMFWLLQQGASILGAACRPEGLNMGLNLGQAAGAGVRDHLHFHIVPRWNGDASFMTSVGEVRVIPEHLDATWALLEPYFSGLSGCPDL